MKSFEVCLAFCPKCLSVLLGPFGFRLGNLGMKPGNWENGGRNFRSSPGANLVCWDQTFPGFPGCSLCAAGEYNQGNCDSGLNSSQKLWHVFMQLPYLVTVVLWEMIKVIIKQDCNRGKKG